MLDRLSIEKIARIMSKKYDITIVFGVSPKVVDNVICLPSFEGLENIHLARYFLDHACGRIVGKSDKKYIASLNKTAFSKVLDLLDGLRTDLILMNDFPGCLHSEKIAAKHIANTDRKGTYLEDVLYDLFAIVKDVPRTRFTESMEILRPMIKKIREAVHFSSSTHDLIEITNEIIERLNIPTDENKEKTKEESPFERLESIAFLSTNKDENVFKPLQRDNLYYVKEINRYVNPQSHDFYDFGDFGEKTFSDFEDFREKTLKEGGKTRHALSMLLRAQKKMMWRGEKRNGRINNSKLHKVITVNETNVMKTRHLSKVKSTRCHVLVDASGSIATRIDNVILAAAVIERCLSIEGYNTSISAFNGRYQSSAKEVLHEHLARQTAVGKETILNILSREKICGHQYLSPTMYKVKTHPQRFNKTIKNLWLVRSCATGYTPIAEAIYFARNQLLSHKSDRYVMLIITDGKPSDTYFARKQRLLTEAFGVNIATISIDRDQFAKIELNKWCPNYALLDDNGDITEETLKKLKELLLPTRKKRFA